MTTLTLSPAQSAFVALSDHCVRCSDCRPAPDHTAETPGCLEAERLYRTWWHLWNEAERARTCQNEVSRGCHRRPPLRPRTQLHGHTPTRPVGQSPVPSDRPSVVRAGRYPPVIGPVLDEFDLVETARAPSTRRAASICPGVVPAMARNSRLRWAWS